MRAFGTNIPKLNEEEAAKLLEQVFMECYMDSNSVPIDQLESYSNYRSERFMLQKIIAIVTMIIFLLLPFWFINPSYTITELPKGERNLPVYEVHIDTWLPLHSVTAVVRGYKIPVYQVDKRTFTVEPIRNGKLEIQVELFSRQYLNKTVKVTTVDDTPPVFEGYEQEEGTLFIYVRDEDFGVDYPKVYAKLNDGQIVYPDEFNEADGVIAFSNAVEEMNIVVPDKLGNELKLHTTTK